jgi:predicted ATPase
MRFGQDIMTTILSYQCLALWLLGYPKSGLNNAKQAIEIARETDQAASLMFALFMNSIFHIVYRNYSLANDLARELFILAREKGALLWKASGLIYQGCVSAGTAQALEAVELITAGIIDYRSTGATCFQTMFLSHLGRAYADLRRFDEAWGCIREASETVETAGEKVWEAELYRISGEITLISRPAETTKAQGYFERALSVARLQQAKSWELRAAMSMARLWRDQGKREKARELLAPIYGWFTEGFDTLDLKEAKALIDELSS